MSELPHCDELFLKFFDRWYDDAGRKRRPFRATYPDVMQNPALIGFSQEQLNRYTPAIQERVLAQISAMLEAARGDMPTYLQVGDEIDLDWIDKFDRYANRSRVLDLIENADPENFGNAYVVNACEFGAVLSHVLRAAQPRLVWQLEWPYWDSCLFDPKTGTGITVFHWAIKKLSEYGVDDGYAAKTKACLHFLQDERKLRD
jgi:hypothetical protein